MPLPDPSLPLLQQIFSIADSRIFSEYAINPSLSTLKTSHSISVLRIKHHSSSIQHSNPSTIHSALANASCAPTVMAKLPLPKHAGQPPSPNFVLTCSLRYATIPTVSTWQSLSTLCCHFKFIFPGTPFLSAPSMWTVVAGVPIVSLWYPSLKTVCLELKLFPLAGPTQEIMCFLAIPCLSWFMPPYAQFHHLIIHPLTDMFCIPTVCFVIFSVLGDRQAWMAVGEDR